MFPNQPCYMPVVSQDISTAVVQQVLTGIGYDKDITQPQFNVMNGKSPSGYPVDSTQFEAVGATQTVGVGPNAEVRQPVLQVTTYKDPETGAIMEVRVPGIRIDGTQFQATGGAISIGMDANGQVALGAPLPPLPSGIGIDSIGQVGSTAFDNFRRSEINTLNATAPNGESYGTTIQTAPNVQQTWDKSPHPGLITSTTDIRNGNNVTRIVETYDQATGRPVSENVFENVHGVNNPNAANAYSLVTTYDPVTGVRRSINRDTGQMEQVAGPTPTGNALALASSNADHTITVLAGDTVTSIARRWGMEPIEYSNFLREQYGPNADLNSIVAGRRLPVPTEVYERTIGGVNGLDLPAESNGQPDTNGGVITPETTDAATQQILDAFQNPIDIPFGPGIQLADAGTLYQHRTRSNPLHRQQPIDK